MDPRLVYRNNGPHMRHNGSFDHKLVSTEQEHADALANGWFDSLPEAINGEHEVTPHSAGTVGEEAGQYEPVDPSQIIRAWLSKKLDAVGIDHDHEMNEDELLFLVCHEFAKTVDDVDDDNDDNDGAPTRAELEAKATELDIKFDGRTTDRKLAAAIEAALTEA